MHKVMLIFTREGEESVVPSEDILHAYAVVCDSSLSDRSCTFLCDRSDQELS